MSGQVPPSSRAGKRNPRANDVQRASDLVERFKGHDAEVLGRFDMPAVPAVLACIGTLDAVCYTTVRDGKTERYIHEFADADRPLLAISPDGSQIHIVGGRYVFTERGIVDLSDTKNLPPGFKKSYRR